VGIGTSLLIRLPVLMPRKLFKSKS
jgi:hypothetical protein